MKLHLSTEIKLQIAVFMLVAAAFTNVYITQPVLPIIEIEFATNAVIASYTVAAVILGITLANLPFGALVDRFSIRPIIATGAGMVAVAGVYGALTDNLHNLIAARFVQGLFLPALTTCVAAYLATHLSKARLSIAMGAYVSATVVGGLSGRLLGGFLHDPLHWRWALVSSAIFVVVAVVVAWRMLPKTASMTTPSQEKPSYLTFLRQGVFVAIYLSAASSFFVFSAVFNYLPFRLESPPFSLSTKAITLLYVTYLVGVFIAPQAGKLTHRVGDGTTMVTGAIVLWLAVLLTLLESTFAVVLSLLLICAGFFMLHAAAVGALNHRAVHGKGRANALYVLFYYFGGWAGITLSGLIFAAHDWQGLVGLSSVVLLLPITIGFWFMQSEQN